MGNCLKTQLKESVNNDNLDKFGYIKLILRNTNTEASGFLVRGTSGKVVLENATFIAGGATKADIIADGVSVWLGGNSPSIQRIDPAKDAIAYITKYDAGVTNLSSQLLYGLELDDFSYLSGLQVYNVRYSDIRGDISYFTDKTQLLEINLSGDNSIIGDVSALVGLTNLNVLRLSSTKVSGDISVLQNLSSLTKLELSLNTTLRGDAGVLGKLNLSELKLPNTKNVSFVVEDFVAYNVAAGRTDKTMSLPWMGAVNASFKGEAIANQSANNVVWAASGDNTSITLNGGTPTVIHVSVDTITGAVTWSRIS